MNMFTEYISSVDPKSRTALQIFIQEVLVLCPTAAEGVSYGLPAFKYNSKSLIGFSAAKKHLNVYPYDPRLVELVRHDLPGYDVGKGVIRFQPDRPLPTQVIELLVSMRMQAIDGRSISV